MSKTKSSKTEHGKTGIMGNGIDYSIYKMDGKEKLVGWLMGLAVGFFAVYLVFHKVFISFVVGAIMGLCFINVYRKQCMKKRDKELLFQFRDLMESLVSSYSAGSNPVDAFATAHNDMSEMYGKDSYMAVETAIISSGLKNGFNITSLLKDFEERIGLEDVKNFVDVFCITYEKGGDMRKVLFDTRVVISEKIEMEQEMKVQLRSNMNEIKVLIVVPVIIDLLFLSDYSMGDSASSGGIISRLVAVALFIGAYVIGNHMIARSQKEI